MSSSAESGETTAADNFDEVLLRLFVLALPFLLDNAPVGPLLKKLSSFFGILRVTLDDTSTPSSPSSAPSSAAPLGTAPALLRFLPRADFFSGMTLPLLDAAGRPKSVDCLLPLPDPLPLLPATALPVPFEASTRSKKEPVFFRPCPPGAGFFANGFIGPDEMGLDGPADEAALIGCADLAKGFKPVEWSESHQHMHMKTLSAGGPAQLDSRGFEVEAADTLMLPSASSSNVLPARMLS